MQLVQNRNHRLSSLFDSFFGDDVLTPRAPTNVPLSMWHDEANFHVEIDAPGLSDKDVDVSVHEGNLYVRWERKAERKGEGFDHRSYGKFEQGIVLPPNVNADKVEARLANGVLHLSLPKIEQPKPRKIAIQS